MSDMRDNRDYELDELFDDPELLRTAYFLKSARSPEPPLDPAFRMALRRALMQRAAAMNASRQPWWKVFTMPPALAWGGAAMAAVLIAIVAALYGVPFGGGGVAVNSDLDHHVNVAVVQPIPVTFSQPMDHASVEAAVSIQPATKVTYQWQGNTLLVQPVSGNLAPNTQYVVQVAPSAMTAAHQPVGEPKTITFVTQTPPTPRPQPVPTPVPTPTPAIAASALQPVGGAWSWSGWSPDGGTIYLLVRGQLAAVSTSGGSVQTLVSDGVSLAALSPDGSKLAYARAGKILTIASDGSGTATTVAEADPVALGWFRNDVVYVQDKQLVSGSTKLALSEKPQLGSFSPGGDYLLYQGAATTHIVDLTNGKDSDLKTSIGPLAWSPDGKQLAWLSGGNVTVGDPASGAGTKVASVQALGGAGFVSWSANGQLMISNQTSLWLAAADGSGLHKVADGDYTAATWAPDASHLAFLRGSALWYGQVTGSKPIPPPGAFDAANAVVGDFMAARVRGDSDAAMSYLDANARQAYSSGGLNLVVRGDTRLSRFYTVLAEQTGASSFRYVVRLVLSRNEIDVSQSEEALEVRGEEGGKPLIHSATGSAARPLGKGPELIELQLVDATHVKASFDSDLDPAAAQQVAVRGPDGSVVGGQGAYSDRTVTLALDHPLAPGASYRLVVPTSLRDVAARTPVAEYDLSFTGPFTPSS